MEIVNHFNTIKSYSLIPSMCWATLVEPTHCTGGFLYH